MKKYIKTIISIFLISFISIFISNAQPPVFQINNGQLISSLNANNQLIYNVGNITGNGAGMTNLQTYNIISSNIVTATHYTIPDPLYSGYYDISINVNPNQLYLITYTNGNANELAVVWPTNTYNNSFNNGSSTNYITTFGTSVINALATVSNTSVGLQIFPINGGPVYMNASGFFNGTINADNFVSSISSVNKGYSLFPGGIGNIGTLGTAGDSVFLPVGSFSWILNGYGAGSFRQDQNNGINLIDQYPNDSGPTWCAWFAGTNTNGITSVPYYSYTGSDGIKVYQWPGVFYGMSPQEASQQYTPGYAFIGPNGTPVQGLIICDSTSVSGDSIGGNHSFMLFDSIHHKTYVMQYTGNAWNPSSNNWSPIVMFDNLAGTANFENTNGVTFNGNVALTNSSYHFSGNASGILNYISYTPNSSATNVSLTFQGNLQQVSLTNTGTLNFTNITGTNGSMSFYINHTNTVVYTNTILWLTVHPTTVTNGIISFSQFGSSTLASYKETQ